MNKTATYISTLFKILILFIVNGNISAQTFTKYQIIHNSADPFLNSIDAFEGLTKYLLKEDFAFRTALPVTTIPSGPVLQEHIAPATPFPPDFPNILVTRSHSRIANENYVIFYSGVYESGFAPNPDSLNTNLNIRYYERLNEKVSTDSVSLVFLNGVTDLSSVDIQVPRHGTVVDNAFYSDQPESFVPTPLKSFKLYAGPTTFIMTDSSGKNQIKAFVGDLSPYKGRSLTLFTSGFYNPSINKNGKPLGLFAATGSGKVFELPSVITSISSFESDLSISVFPIPASDNLNITNSNKFSEEVVIEITTLEGKVINPLSVQRIGNDVLNISQKGFINGTYILKITDNGKVTVLKYVVDKK